MIRFIVTDVDGTLVKDGSPEVYPELFDVVKQLKERGMIFAVASGRQYDSIRRMFEPIANDMIFIAENGSHVVCRGQKMDVTLMDPKMAREVIEELRTLGEGYDLVVSTPNGCYIESKNKQFLDLIRHGYRNKMTLVEDVLKEPLSINKVAVFHRPSIRDIGEGRLIPKWKDKLKVCMAGEDWVDFMDLSVDKGKAMEKIQKFFGILPEETMAFGDNGNDLGMMKMAKESYAVETGREEVKKAAKYICGSYEKKGVYEVMKSLL